MEQIVLPFLCMIQKQYEDIELEGRNMTLHELPVGQSAIITKVGGEGELRYRFLDMGLIPKTKVTVTKIAPMGDPIEIRLRGYTLTLRVEDAKNIEITTEGDTV